MIPPIGRDDKLPQTADQGEHKLDKKTSRKVMGYVALGSMIMAGGVLIGSFITNKTNSEQPSPNKLPGSKPPISEKQAAAPTEKKISVPAEAKSFVDEFGSRYTNPVASYYAEKSYESQHGGKKLVMTDNYINKYEISDVIKGETSELGFAMTRLPLDATISQETMMQLFNDRTANNLSLLINLLAINTSPKGQEIIKSQFLNACSDTWSERKNDDDRDVQNLFNTASSIANKIGNNSICKVMPASNQDGTDGTYFNSNINPEIQGIDKNGNTTFFAYNNVVLAISVDSFNDDGKMSNSKMKPTIDLSYMRKPAVSGAKFTYLSAGQR